MTISFSYNNQYAYISAHRDDSYGYQDIYKVEFHNNTDNKAVIIFTTNSGAFGETDEMVITDDNDKIIGIYHPNKKGKLIVILEQGKYNVTIDSEERMIYKDFLIITNFHLQQGTVFKSISTY
jgi:hypothetical protein